MYYFSSFPFFTFPLFYFFIFLTFPLFHFFFTFPLFYFSSFFTFPLLPCWLFYFSSVLLSLIFTFPLFYFFTFCLFLWLFYLYVFPHRRKREMLTPEVNLAFIVCSATPSPRFDTSLSIFVLLFTIFPVLSFLSWFLDALADLWLWLYQTMRVLFRKSLGKSSKKLAKDKHQQMCG